MSESGEEWELSKENIRPIQQGRKQNVLKVALAPHPEDIIAQQRLAFENELRTYSGTDPLAIWCNYIKWVEQNYPKGGREGHIKKLMDSCLSILKDEKKYFDDERFIDILLKYANLSGKPIEIYNYMYSSKIGCKSAKFFINWSWELEQLGNLKKADEILTEGMKHKAEPIEKLQAYLADFEIRLANKIKTNSENSNFEAESSRSAFAVLKPQKKNLAPIMRTGTAVIENKSSLVIGRQQPQPKSSTSSGRVPFRIYDAENINPSLPVQGQSVAHSGFSLENFKENEQKPIKWNKFKVKAHGLKTPNETNPDFKFHCDDENGQQIQTPRSVPKTSNILSIRRRTPSPPMALFEPPDPFKKPMYPKNKVYGGAVEYSLEEIRAAEWREKKKKIDQENLLKEQQRKIEEHAKNEEQLKREIEFLAKRLQLLEKITASAALNKLPSTSVMKTDALDFENKINSNEFNSILNKQTKSVIQAQNDEIPIQPPQNASDAHSNTESIFKKNLQNFNCSSEKNSESTSFCTADKMLQELYNKTLSHVTDEEENKNLNINKVNEIDLTHGISKESTDKLPFTFYHDPTGMIPNSNEMMPSRELFIENSLSSLNTDKEIDGTQSSKKASDKLPFTFYHDSTGKIPDIHGMTPFRGIMNGNTSSLNSNKIHDAQITAEVSDKLPFTFYHDPTQNTLNSSELSHKHAILKKSCNELPFTLFHGSTKEVLKSNETASAKEVAAKEQFELPHEESSEEDVENIPPNGFVENKTKRELAGILQPSKNILFIPLEQQEMDDDSDIEDDYIYQNGEQHTDETLIPPSNTEQFSTAKFLASTPYMARNCKNSISEESSHQVPPPGESISQNLCPPSVNLNLSKKHVINDENAISKIEMNPCKEPVLNSDLKSTCSTRLPNILSVIMENSSENYSKSSSSSSSASLTKSNHLEHFSLHKTISKLETCEPSTVNSISEVSNHNLDINVPNSNVIMHRENNEDANKMQLYSVDFDPFDESIIRRLLKSISISNYKNICHVNKSIRAIKCGESICIGDSMYIIESLIAEGAYAKVYKAVKSFVSGSHNHSTVLALKACKKGNEWEFYICCEIHKRLSELKLMPDIKNSVMDVVSAIKYYDGIVLANEYSASGTLLDVVNFYKKQNSTMPELITLYFTLEILQIVSKLHKCNIIHGDIKPDNFLLINDNFDFNVFEKMTETTCLKLIDFGRAIDLNVYEKGICFTTIFSSKDLQCNEMKDKKPWVFQLDWYGVLSCIYTMLFSEYMKVNKKNGVWEIEKKFRRYWLTSLWEPLFNKLLNIPECYEEPDISPFISMIESKLRQNSSTFINLLTRFSCAYSQRI